MVLRMGSATRRLMLSLCSLAGVVAFAPPSRAADVTSVSSFIQCGPNWRVNFPSSPAGIQFNPATGDLLVSTHQVGINNYGAHIVLDSQLYGNVYRRQFLGNTFTMTRAQGAVTRAFGPGTANPAVIGSTTFTQMLGLPCTVSVTAFLANVPGAPPTPTPVPTPAKPLKLNFTYGLANNTLTPSNPDANGNTVAGGVYNFGLTLTLNNPAYTGVPARFVLVCDNDAAFMSWPQNYAIGNANNDFYNIGGTGQSIGGRWSACARTTTAKVFARRYDPMGPQYGEVLSDPITVTALGSPTGMSFTYVSTAFSAAKRDMMNVAGAKLRYVASTQGYTDNAPFFGDYCAPRLATASGRQYLVVNASAARVDRLLVSTPFLSAFQQAGYVTEGFAGFTADSPNGTVPLKLFRNAATGDTVTLPDERVIYGSSWTIDQAVRAGYQDGGQIGWAYPRYFCLRDFED